MRTILCRIAQALVLVAVAASFANAQDFVYFKKKVAAAGGGASLAYDAVSAATAGTGNLSWTHTPVGTPKGIIVFVTQGGSATGDHVTGVTYGGTAMTEVSGSPSAGTGDEPGVTYAYFLGASIPAGAQTVVVSVDDASSKIAYAVSVVAPSDTSVNASVANPASGNAINPAANLSLSGVNSFVAMGFASSKNDITSTTPFVGWTDRGEVDFTNDVGGVYTYDTVGASDVSVGFTATSGGYGFMGVAVREAP